MTDPTARLPVLRLGDGFEPMGTVTAFDIQRAEDTDTFEYETKRVYTAPGPLTASFEVNYVHPDVRKILFPSTEEPPHTVEMVVDAEHLVTPPGPRQPERHILKGRYHQAMRTWQRARKNFKAHGPQPYLAGYKAWLPAFAVTSVSAIPGGYTISGSVLHKGAEDPVVYQFHPPEEHRDD